MAGRVRSQFAALSAILLAIALAPLVADLATRNSQPTMARAQAGPKPATPVPEQSYGKLPLSYAPSAGRYGGIDYLTDSAAGGVAVGARGITFSQSYGSEADPRSAQIRLALPRATLSRPVAHHRLPGVINDLRGAPSDHRIGIPTFKRVSYANVWPGVDLELHGRSGAPEYDFKLAPGVDPGRVSVRVGGADRLRVTGTGDVLIRAGGAAFRQRAPLAYQPSPHGPRPVDAAFVRKGSRLAFRLGDYDKSRPLVIDPVSIAYSTYLGGGQADILGRIAVDNSGAAYVAGSTDSDDFAGKPVENNPMLGDAFVSKLSPSGDSLVYTTFLGGAGNDGGTGLVVDSDEAVYVVGVTDDAADFPTTPGAFERGSFSQTAGFVAKLSPSGSSLIYSTLLGAEGKVFLMSVAPGPADSVYIGGWAEKGFPSTPGSFQEELEGGSDGFVAKLDQTGADLNWATYLGGSEADQVSALTADDAGDVYAVGFTNSPDFDTVHPIQTQRSDFDSFVTKLDRSGESLAYSTYLGGSDLDALTSIAVGDDGAAYAGGFTLSSDYPTVGQIEGDSGTGDAVVSKINPAGTALGYSTYLGGNGFDLFQAIAVDDQGGTWLSGTSDSDDFDLVNPIEGHSEAKDGIVASLSPTGSLRFATYLGGDGDGHFRQGDDHLLGMALGDDGVYVSGYTDSLDYGTKGEIQGSTGSLDGIVTKLNYDEEPPATRIDAGPTDGSRTPDRTPTFSFSSDEDASTFRCSLVPAGRQASFAPCSGPGAFHTPAGDLPDGPYEFSVRATDPFGNTDPSPARAHFSVASPAEPPKCLGHDATIGATSGDDVIAGTPGADVVDGEGGDDVVRGLGGNDLVCGGPGDDRLAGGRGSDDLRGRTGRDTLSGGPARDSLGGGPGRDRCGGGSSRNRILGCEASFGRGR